jgi:hypothetical protein
MRAWGATGPVGVALLAAVGLAAANASAATVALDRSCYSPGDTVTETGAGFSPNGGVGENLSLIEPGGGITTFQAPDITADANGAFTRMLKAPNLASDRDRTEQAASGFSDQVLGPGAPPVAATAWTLSAWAASIPEWFKKVGDPSRSMLVDTFGWTTAGKTLYAHYYRATTFVKAVKLGALTGPCGNFKKRVKQFPFKKVKAGAWSIFLSTSSALNKGSDPWIKFKATVPKSKATA